MILPFLLLPSPAPEHDPEWYIRALRAKIDEPPAPPPDNLAGDGIIYSADGRIWLMAVLSVRMLRESGCRLPVQVHCWGPHGRELDGAEGTTLIEHDSREMEKCHRFGTKMEAINISGWRRTLFFDSDCYPLVDPTSWFDLLTDWPAVIWEGYCSGPPFDERFIGFAPTVPQPMSGVYLLDVVKFWREFCLVRWLHSHWPYFFQHGRWHDEGCIAMALSALRTSYFPLPCELSPNPMRCNLRGETVAIHRIGPAHKLWPNCMPRWSPETPGEKRVQAIWRELAGAGYREAIFAPCSAGRPARAGTWRQQRLRAERRQLLSRRQPTPI
jgi:Mannosyltransferase putative